MAEEVSVWRCQENICSVSAVKNKKRNGDVIEPSQVKSDILTEIPEKQPQQSVTEASYTSCRRSETNVS